MLITVFCGCVHLQLATNGIVDDRITVGQRHRTRGHQVTNAGQANSLHQEHRAAVAFVRLKIPTASDHRRRLKVVQCGHIQLAYTDQQHSQPR